MALLRSPTRIHIMELSLLVVITFLSIQTTECWRQMKSESFDYKSINCRAHSASLADFGAVGDGVTLNTKAFQAAIDHLSQFASDGGAQLFVPPGKWLTGSFNLTSNFTLYLHKDAVILGSQNMDDWPLIDPLPSYGRGRDAPGGRYSSLIRGSNLTDVVITGDNGTIDGQGALWWDKFRNKQLNFTRGHLIELMFSDLILISNLNLVNSPAWNVHPIYSRRVIVKGITIRAPLDSPNTDGINPDSCSGVRIEDCYIESGDDCIAIKSGWDEYGIAFGMPTKHVIIRRLTCISPTSAVIAIGSEMSGGVRDVRAEDITAINSESGIRIKTSAGRGGYVKDIFARRFTMHTMKWVFWMTSNYGDHPDDHYDPNALATVDRIHYSDMVAENVTMAGKLEGFAKSPFFGICIGNVTIQVAPSKNPIWNCTGIRGISSDVTPQPCKSLPDQGYEINPCTFAMGALPIERVEFKECKYKSTHL